VTDCHHPWRPEPVHPGPDQPQPEDPRQWKRWADQQPPPAHVQHHDQQQPRTTRPKPIHGSRLRHYYASLLISSGLDVKVVQTRMRHSSAKTTLDTYGHLWPDSDDSTRAAISSVIAARAELLADYLRTHKGS
jgi:integrase